MGMLISRRRWLRDAWLARMRERPEPLAPMTGGETLAILRRQEDEWQPPESWTVIVATAGSSGT